MDDIITDIQDKGIKTEQTEVTKGSGRKITAHQIRTSRAKLKLTRTQEDASREISEAYELVHSGFGYALLGIKTTNPLRVKGGEMRQEVIDRIRKKIGRLHEWEFCAHEDWVHSVKAIEYHGLTANEYSRRISRPKKTIMEWYKKGLDEYGVLRGW